LIDISACISTASAPTFDWMSLMAALCLRQNVTTIVSTQHSSGPTSHYATEFHLSQQLVVCLNVNRMPRWVCCGSPTRNYLVTKSTSTCI